MIPLLSINLYKRYTLHFLCRIIVPLIFFYFISKVFEPGGGFFVHVAYLSHIALHGVNCEPLVKNSSIPPLPLSVCLTFNGDVRRDLLEWLAFHRLQGVARFDVFWDVVNAFNATNYNEFLNELDPFLAPSGDVFAWKKDDLILEAKRIIDTSKTRNGDKEQTCGLSNSDLDELSMRIQTCLERDAGWSCQGAVNAVCLAAAKLRGDEWLGLIDAVDFFFCTWSTSERKGMLLGRRA
jgi:hypothetical protein